MNDRKVLHSIKGFPKHYIDEALARELENLVPGSTVSKLEERRSPGNRRMRRVFDSLSDTPSFLGIPSVLRAYFRK